MRENPDKSSAWHFIPDNALEFNRCLADGLARFQYRTHFGLKATVSATMSPMILELYGLPVKQSKNKMSDSVVTFVDVATGIFYTCLYSDITDFIEYEPESILD